MKYLKRFESNDEYDNMVIEVNERIFTELDILEDFKENLSDKVDFSLNSSNNIWVNFRSVNYTFTPRFESQPSIEQLKELIDRDKDIELPTYNYHISIRKDKADVDFIKAELDVLHKRFEDLSTCVLINENITIQTKSNKIYTKSIDSSVLPKNQKLIGNHLITETSDINLTIVYMNKKADRYKKTT